MIGPPICGSLEMSLAGIGPQIDPRSSSLPAPEDMPEDAAATSLAINPEIAVATQTAPVSAPLPIDLSEVRGTQPFADVTLSTSEPGPTPSPAPLGKQRRKASEPETVSPGITQKFLRDGRVAFLAEPDNDEAAARLAAACDGHAKSNRQYRNWLCETDAAEMVRATLLTDSLAGTGGATSGPQPANLHAQQG